VTLAVLLAAAGGASQGCDDGAGDGGPDAGGDGDGDADGDGDGDADADADADADTDADADADTDTDADADADRDCAPATCASLGAECGDVGDGCGGTLGCGACPGDQRCGGDGVPNLCGAPACVPAREDTREGGGQCADLDQAWTGRGINVGYYPYLVAAPIEQYSGDYSGDPAAVFSAGAASPGVILQIIPAGSYVGLSSTGPWYDPPVDCFDGASCGAEGRSACSSSSPPMRSIREGFAWGYAYSGASHMQGWILFDPSRLVFAGFDAAHPCALGPAGLDYEVHEACGAPMECDGANPTCGDVNGCDEGADDCGRTECGAESGGALTPSAHRMTLSLPSSAVACTTRTPPHPSVLCLANGSVVDHFFVYPFGAYLYWAQDSTTKAWLHYGDQVQAYYHTRDRAGVLWDFVEVLSSGAPALTPESDGTGGLAPCSSDSPESCHPCRAGGTCGWIQHVFLE
jgi:hypothetical protein